MTTFAEDPAMHARALTTSLARRREWSRLKHDLKFGRVPIALALDASCAQDKPIVALVGYALLRWPGRYPSPRRHPVQCRIPALDILQTLDVGPFLPVAALSAARKAQVARAVGTHRLAARPDLVVPLEAVE